MRLPLPLLALVALLIPATTFAAAPAIEQPVQRPRLDVAFLLDTTGSMGDELDVVKEKLIGIARSLRAGQPAPDVRYALIAFRDQGDEYVTKVYDFDRDVVRVQSRVAALSAGGGGDEPEDVAAALQAATKLSWDSAPEVTRVAFLVGDAGPHAYPGKPTWQQALTNLRERKISVDTIGCSGLTGASQSVFKLIAEKSAGHFQTLTYSRVEHLADGRKRTVLMSGDAAYVADKELTEADWKRGAEALAKEGKVHAAPRGSIALGSGSGGGAMAGLTAAPAAAMPMNNLDSAISDRLRSSAEAAGARYAH